MIISPDSYLLDSDGKYIWSPKNVKNAWAAAQEKWKEFSSKEEFEVLALVIGPPGSGKTTFLSKFENPKWIYFDATNVAPKRRKHLLSLVKSSKLQKVAIVIDTPAEVCIKRNEERTPDRKVPADVMKRMLDNLKMPDKSEGFDKIITIKS